MSYNFAVATKGLVVNKNNKYLILTKTKEEALEDKSDNLFDIPGGRVEYGEDLKESIEREIFEETGMNNLKIGKVINASSFIRDDGLQLIVITFLIHINNDEVVLSDEHSAYSWVSENELSVLPEWIIEIINKSKI